MPELPEVEVTRQGIAPALSGRAVSAVHLRTPRLRYPLPHHLVTTLPGKTLDGITRRGKYLLLDFTSGSLLLHLGMSGTLRLLPPATPAGRHDHVDLVFGDLLLRLNDPRRFGALLWVDGQAPLHPLLADLGMEPLERGFTAAALRARLVGRSLAIKPALMDGRVVVGVGNIYASEALFRAAIHPCTPAGQVTMIQLRRLVPAIKRTLRAAIRAGGSSLRDFFGCDGAPGHFQLEHQVYGRAGEACRNCRSAIVGMRQGQRTTYFCPQCQAP